MPFLNCAAYMSGVRAAEIAVITRGINQIACGFAARISAWKASFIRLMTLLGLVGWVERSETHHSHSDNTMGIAVLNPSYDLPITIAKRT
jgi:hypothetical protein